jgi:hypothetical protein
MAATKYRYPDSHDNNQTSHPGEAAELSKGRCKYTIRSCWKITPIKYDLAVAVQLQSRLQSFRR